MAFSTINCVSLLFCIISMVHTSAALTAYFDLQNITVHMSETKTINITIAGLDGEEDIRKNNETIRVISDSEILHVSHGIPLDDIKDGNWSGQFNITGVFLGNRKIGVGIFRQDELNIRFLNETLPVIIVREERLIDKLFTISVAALVSILYINFGAALDLTKVKEILVRPIGPLIAFVCQFLFMPLMSYFLGMILFPDNVEMQLGLFFTGVSPSGGASNIWSVILGGNLDLSISMTTISTFSAFAMMPLWLFTLGATIFVRGHLVVPYSRIAAFGFGLIIPLAIGLLIQRFFPKLAKILVRVLKSCSSLLIVFIVVFAIITNLYLFQLFTWQIFVAGLGLPWLAYIFGFVIATIFKQKHEDRLAISIEAGIQNTGIAIYILRFALGQPQADLTTVIPVSVAIMTPFPLLAYYLSILGRDRFIKYRRGAMRVPTSPPVAMTTFDNKEVKEGGK